MKRKVVEPLELDSLLHLRVRDVDLEDQGTIIYLICNNSMKSENFVVFRALINFYNYPDNQMCVLDC